MDAFNIYLTGVGGQGIGLLSEIVLRAGDHAGLPVKGVDTHGLAQRGGIVQSRIRLGSKAHSPLIPAHEADLVVALERHEALRAMNLALKDNGTLLYYNTAWQPLDVRLGRSDEISVETIAAEARLRGVRVFKVFDSSLADARMQNVALLAVMAGNTLVPGVEPTDYRAAMEDLMAGGMLAKNTALFDAAVSNL